MFNDFPTVETSQMKVFRLRPRLVEMLFSFQMHQVEFVDEAQALEKI